MGRPTKLDDLMVQRIVNAVRDGLGRRETAMLCGIDDSTLYRWLAENSEFRDRVKAAEAEGEKVLLDTIRAASERQWQAAAWMLERRYPERYARREAEDPLTVEEAEKLVAEAAKLAGAK